MVDYLACIKAAPSAQTWVRSIHKKWHDSFVSFKCWHWEQGKGQGHKLDWLVLSQSRGARDTTSKSPVSFIHCKFILLQILDLESFLQQRVIIGRWVGGREKRRFLDARELPKLPLLLLGGHLDHPGLVDDPRRPETSQIESDVTVEKYNPTCFLSPQCRWSRPGSPPPSECPCSRLRLVPWVELAHTIL